MEASSLEMINITKRFPGVTALDGVTFRVRPGETHALVGENGAGKSTLMKILGGVYPAGSYDGDIHIDGTARQFRTVRDSEKAGIAVIFQELALAENMTVAENLFMGNEIQRFGVIDGHKTHYRASEALKAIGLDIPPETPLGALGIGMRQLVEIAKALMRDASILILDEPTAALTGSECEILFGLLDGLKARGVTCVYISHKLQEVFRLCDSVTVLRDGRTVATRSVADLTEEDIIAMMVGRSLGNLYPHKERIPGETVLSVRGWSVRDPDQADRLRIRDVDLDIRRNEVLGIAGLMGAGRTEFAMSLIGAYGQRVAGSLELEGKPLKVRNPKTAVEAGIGYLSEDRKGAALNLLMDIRENITLSSLDKVSTAGVLDGNREIREAGGHANRLGVKTPSLEQTVSKLSGGNQQKEIGRASCRERV